MRANDDSSVDWEPFRPAGDPRALPARNPGEAAAIGGGRVEHAFAHALLESMHRTTPGGIRREQFLRTRHPLKTALAAFPFIALVALAILAVATRHS